jgi:2-iminobutanoate/2-iminopropanoate deaminase
VNPENASRVPVFDLGTFLSPQFELIQQPRAESHWAEGMVDPMHDQVNSEEDGAGRAWPLHATEMDYIVAPKACQETPIPAFTQEAVTVSPLQRLRRPEQLPEPISQYTDGVVADGWIWISGMIALDASGAMIGGDDVVAQAERVHENIKAVLAKAGAGFEDVVKVTVYLRRIGDRAAVNTVRRRSFVESRRASTPIEVSAFVLPDALVEIDAVPRQPESSR